LKQGLNLVGFACAPIDYSVFDLIQSLGDSNVSNVQRFNPDTNAFETAGFDKDGNITGVNFVIVPGEGYFVHMKQAVDGFMP